MVGDGAVLGCIPGLGTRLDTVTALLVPLCVTLGDVPPFQNDPCADGDAGKPQTQSMGRVAGTRHFQPQRFKETHTCKWIQKKTPKTHLVNSLLELGMRHLENFVSPKTLRSADPPHRAPNSTQLITSVGTDL